MANIRPIDQIAKKWSSVTPMRVEDYAQGVQNPRKDWQQSTAAANDAWKSGIQQAVAEDRFKSGVAKAGTSKWQKGAVEKGTQRWGAGVQQGESAYAQGFAPYADAIARTNLPPRYARRDPRNLERVKAIVNAMVDTAKRSK